MNILPSNFSSVEMPQITQGVTDMLANFAPLLILLASIILGFFVARLIVDVVKNRHKGSTNTQTSKDDL